MTDNKLPCKDCILLPRCITKVKVVHDYEDRIVALSSYGLCTSCKLLYDYCIEIENDNQDDEQDNTVFTSIYNSAKIGKLKKQIFNQMINRRMLGPISLKNPRYTETNEYFKKLMKENGKTFRKFKVSHEGTLSK